jgi:TrmH family RNA methyltransferase
MEITSSQNPKLKRLKKLKSKKYRDQFQAYLLEGYKSIALAMEEEAAIEGIFMEKAVAEDVLKRLSDHPGFRPELAYVVEDGLLQDLYETESPQGILAMVKKRVLPFKVDHGGVFKNIVLLDRIQDPGNLGTIIRTAEGAGYDLVLCGHGCADLYNSKTIRSTMGSIVTMPVLNNIDAVETAISLKDKGYTIYCAALRESQDYRQVPTHQPHLLVLGNEASGIQDELLACSDHNVKIPMQGKVESLNVSVAAGILLYHFGDA